ncbi:MAG: 5-bromo-4-chloroindolyl phosphate hydrolysis family protein [Clostridia bacterium]|nr:5-bromo-4-chloroindolyl phosphate hydrolysis family protein [Clostridia bacterium]
MKVKRLLRKLDYLPRWAWYLLSACVAFPVGPLLVYLAFHVLENAAKDEAETDEDRTAVTWDIDVDKDGVHVRSRSAGEKTAYSAQSREDVERRWQQTEASASKARSQYQQAARKAEAPAGKADPIREDASVDEVIRDGQVALKRIRHANDLIPDPALSAQIDSIENSCRQILSILEQRPQLLSNLRTFLRYYLPTTLNLLDARAKLENTANTPKAIQVRQRISEALGVIDKAFLQQVAALDEYRFIDLESEMDVLRDMLAADGLITDETKQEDDPFADVLGKRASSAKNAQNHGKSLTSGGAG